MMGRSSRFVLLAVSLALSMFVAFAIFWPVTDPDHVEAISSTVFGFLVAALVHWYVTSTG